MAILQKGKLSDMEPRETSNHYRESMEIGKKRVIGVHYGSKE